MSANARQKLVFTVVLVLIGAGIAGVTGWKMFEKQRDLIFIVVFEDARQLQAGQPLVYQGVKIGEVTEVSLGGEKVNVAVSVDAEHASRVYHEAIFQIERSTPIFGERQLTMKDRPGDRTPITRGAIIAGTEGFFDGLLKKAQGAVESVVATQSETK